MASEEERTETTSEAPEKIRMKFVMIVSLSIFKSREQAPATITLMIILSQRFDSISNTLTKSFVVWKDIWSKTLNAILIMWINVASNQRNISRP